MSVSSRKSRIAGIGFLIDQEDPPTIALPPSPHGPAGTRRCDDAHGVAIDEEADTVRDDLLRGIDTADDLDAVARAAADRHLGLHDLAVGVQPENVVETVAHLHRRLRQRQRARLAERDFAAREHAGLGVVRFGDIDIHQTVARLRIDGRRNHADRARRLGPARREDRRRHARLESRQIAGGHIGPPFQAITKNQTKKLLPRLHDGADGRQPGGDRTRFRCLDLGLCQANFVGADLGLEHGETGA